jgi:hypothetical protein
VIAQKRVPFCHTRWQTTRPAAIGRADCLASTSVLLRDRNGVVQIGPDGTRLLIATGTMGGELWVLEDPALMTPAAVDSALQ